MAIAGTALVQGLGLLLRPTMRTASALVVAATLPAAYALGIGPGLVAWPALAFLAGRRGGGRVVAAAFAAAFAAAWGVDLLRRGPADAVAWPVAAAVPFGL